MRKTGLSNIGLAKKFVWVLPCYEKPNEVFGQPNILEGIMY